MAAAATAAKTLQSCLTLCDPIDAAHQAPPSMGFSRQEQATPTAQFQKNKRPNQKMGQRTK